jgi:hypothetical protein
MAEVVDVTACWDTQGEITPLNFTWQGRAYQVVSIGRRWRDETGQHILCMAPGDQVFELVFQAAQECWLMAFHPVRPAAV